MSTIDNVSSNKISCNAPVFTSQKLQKLPEQQPDSVELSNKKAKKKKVGIAVALSTLATAAVALACMIGRNPAKAAKVLKGSSQIMDDVYIRGNKMADDLLNKPGKTSLDDLLGIFKKPKHKTKFHEDLASLDDYIRKNNIPEDSELVKAVKEFKGKYEQHITDVEKRMQGGELVDDFKLGEQFASENEKLIDTIRQNLGFDYAGRSKFYKFDVAQRSKINRYIEECPSDVLPADGIFYHGTKKTRGIYKEGFTPFKSRQSAQYARELGAGVYITPDSKVASYFSGLFGDIIPVKMQKGAKVAYLDEATYKDLYAKMNNFLSERIDLKDFKNIPDGERNAIVECMLNKIFTKAGYDAAYIPKGVKSGGIMAWLAPDINKVIGREQKQLVVFKAENLEIVSRNFSERVCDIGDKFNSLKNAISYMIKN